MDAIVGRYFSALCDDTFLLQRFLESFGSLFHEIGPDILLCFGGANMQAEVELAGSSVWGWSAQVFLGLDLLLNGRDARSRFRSQEAFTSLELEGGLKV